MADQRARGGQKQGAERQPRGKRNRDVRAGEDTGKHDQRDMKEDARRGRQGEQGGFIAREDEEE
jgi:hypothetical protein